MKKVLITAAALAGLVGTPAVAADMALKAPPPVAAVASWTGFYLGVNAGGDWGTSDPSTSMFCGPGPGSCYIQSVINNINALGARTSFNTSGFTGGVQGGYNWQSGNFLAGLELDFESFRSSGSNSLVGPNPPFAGSFLTIAASTKTDWLFTARPRVGVVVSNNWLLYGTGGLAVTDLKVNWNYSENTAPAAESAAVSTTKAGWTAGGGLETMLPGRFSLGLEYLYLKFNSVSATSTNLIFAGGPTPNNIFVHSADLKANIVRLRLNKEF